ncbi:MAG: alpha/beta hydrolase [Eubacteriales bacterium]|nr:alpha/beta hydrolase [Eubacteriales bacterium]
MQQIKEYKLWEKVTFPEQSSDVTITYYPTRRKAGRGAVIIFPGGGYACLCDWEGDTYANMLNTLGIDAFIVKNRVKPYTFPLPLLDARRAVRFVRANADAFGIDKDKIAVIGSSAGGHLAALLSTYRGKIDGEGADLIDDEDYLPNAQILCYPVICMYDEKVTHLGSNENFLGKDWTLDMARTVSPDLIADEKTPVAFIWHTSNDNCVSVLNSLRYAQRLREVDVPAEVLIYPVGWHGQSIAPNSALNRQWWRELDRWLRYIGFIVGNE